MAILTNNASNLPGMAIEFKDGGLVLRADTIASTTTRSVLLIGTAQDGPIMQPVAVDASSAELVFGKSVDLNGKVNGATIPEAFNQVFKGGCRDVRMMRISGAPAVATINGLASTLPTPIIKQETLGNISGNDAVTFTVKYKPIDEGSVALFANGNPISSAAFTSDAETGVISLLANQVTAGSSITVQYSYFDMTNAEHKTGATLESLPAFSGSDATKTALFDERPINTAPKKPLLKIDGITQAETTHYTVNPDTQLVSFTSKRKQYIDTTAMVVASTTQNTGFVDSAITQTTAPVAGSTYQLANFPVVSVTSVTVGGITINPVVGVPVSGEYSINLTTGAMTFGDAFTGAESISVIYHPFVGTYQLGIPSTPISSVTSVTVGGSVIVAGSGAGKYTVDLDTGLITLGTKVDPATLIEVIYVKYGTTYTLSNTNIDSISTILYNGVTTLTSPTDYSVVTSTGVITFVAPKDPAKSISVTYLKDVAPVNGDVVVADYWYAAGVLVTATESDNGAVPAVAWTAPAANPQTFALAESTTTDKLRVYINGREIGDRSTYTLTTTSGVTSIGLTTSNYNLNDLVDVSYEYEENTGITPTITLETICGGSLYNEASYKVEKVTTSLGTVIDNIITINKPISKKVTSEEKALTYKATTYPTYHSLVQAINNDVLNVFGGLSVFLANTEFPDSPTLTIPSTAANTTVKFTGGNDGLNITKQTIFDKLSGKRNNAGELTEIGAYQLLQNYTTDYIIPCGVYADDQLVGKYDSFAYELAMLCAVASQTHLTHGIIQLKPPLKTDLLSLEDWVKNAESLSNLYFMRTQDGSYVTDSEGEPFDLGGYISVIAGPELTYTSSRMGTYSDVGTYPYASMMTTLKASSSPTNKPITTAYGMRYSLSISQLNRLAGKRFVTFQRRISDNAITTTDGVTAARAGSDYSRVVNVNVVRECLSALYKIAEPYIGEPMSVASNNALSSAISKKYTEFSDAQSGIIETYSFQLIANPEDKLIGDSKIELSLVPLGERRKITVVVGLRPSL